MQRTDRAASWVVARIRRWSMGSVFMLPLALGACSTPPPAQDVEAVEEFNAANDPVEPMNRKLYDISGGINQVLLGPLGYGYRWVVPSQVRNGIHHALDNASSPVDFANHLLQGKPCRAADTLLRFVINTTFGLGGLIDAAQKMRIPAQTTDFGITLGRWGVPEGPYLYVLLLGPSNPRDLVGSGVDLAADPWSWIVAGKVFDDIDWIRLGMHATDSSERWLDEVQRIKRTSLDPYVTYRSVYRGHRAFAVEMARADDGGVACGDPP